MIKTWHSAQMAFDLQPPLPPDPLGKLALERFVRGDTDFELISREYLGTMSRRLAEAYHDWVRNDPDVRVTQYELLDCIKIERITR